METPHPTLPPELAFIVAASHIADSHLSWISEKEVQAPYRQLLVHDHDMTSELAAFHNDEITLEVLRSERHPHCYLREVVLHAATSNSPVEYGLIEILIESFPESLQPEILAGITPLGTLIIEAELPFHSEPQGFFSIPTKSLAGIFPESAGSEILFGRYNHLILDDGRCLARILEILPPAT